MKNLGLQLPARLALLALAACACKGSTSKPATGSSASIAPGDRVAVVDGAPITYADVEKETGAKLRQAEIKALSELYDARRSAVEDLVNKRLLEGEAKVKGKSLEQWFQQDFIPALPAPSDAEVKAFYEEHAQQLGGQPFEAVKDRLAQGLRQQKGRDQMTKMLADLRQKHGVQVTLQPPNLPRVEVAASGPSRGPTDAPVTIIEFSDFQCPFCSRAAPVVERVLKEYEGKVRLVFRHFPLDIHPQAAKAAEASACADEQGKFWAMHDKMFGNQQKLGVDDLKGYAKELGLDAGKFDKCLDSGQMKSRVNVDEKAGQDAGVSGTPAFFVNGVFINGAVPYEQFKQAVDRELKQRG